MPDFYKTISSPVGVLTLVANDTGLVAVLWENDAPHRVRLRAPVLADNHSTLRDTECQLGEYFARERRTFALPLDVRGTDFQQRVWTALRTIPFGETRTYAQIARQVGRPTAARAVGAATGRNPLSIVIPCHRVIGSTGKLTGFAGGLDVKAHLLALEAASQFGRSVPPANQDDAYGP